MSTDGFRWIVAYLAARNDASAEPKARPCEEEDSV